MIGVVDYGAGNLLSVTNALKRLELPFTTCEQAGALQSCSRIILPGVGHFGAAARQLQKTGMAPELVRLAGEGRPIIGICLGMQLLFESSDEDLEVPGLALMRGSSRRLDGGTVPHMGWNTVRWGDEPTPNYVYYAHSYEVRSGDAALIAATAPYEGRPMVAAVQRGSIVGMQFHPEKSGDYGLDLLRRFATC
jgi:glutamine amidotransferase